MDGWNLLHLKFLLENHADRRFLRTLLLNPRNVKQALEQEEESIECAETILKHLANDKETTWLFTLWMVSVILISPHAYSKFTTWLTNRLKLSSILPTLEWEDALAGIWTEVPVLLRSEKIHIRYLVAGYLTGPVPEPCWPNWMETLLDTSTLVSLETAFRASASIDQLPTGMTPYVYFLSDMRVVTGSSLGLPLALALSMLIKGERPPENLIATGAVNDSGSVCSVAHVEDKISYAASNGFKIALVPESSRIKKLPENFELQKVSTLEEARLFASLHRPGNAPRLSVFSALVRDPDGFIGASRSAEPGWLKWIARERPEAISGAKLVSSVARATSLVNVLEKFVKEEELYRAEPIARLVDQNHLPLMEKHSPASAFRWCVLNMAIANHRGMINEARAWNARAEVIMGKTPITNFEWAVGCYNHMFVGFCHNLYCFIPDLPDYVGHVLEVVEGVYKSQRKFAPAKIAAYRPLGELCGSIAQNFGFCGPEYLEDLEIFIKKAMDAFGAGKIPDLREDWRRQFNYLVYAYLDTEKWDKAEEALCNYLEIGSLADLSIKLVKLGRWEHAVLARFFADTGLHTAAADYYYRKASNLAPTIVEKRHPWQLWLNNMAKLAMYRDDLDHAAVLHRQSLDLCISDSSGPTIKMMAMLALAGLYKIGRLNKKDMVKAKDDIKEALNIVDRNHFSDLINAQYHAMPAIVAAVPNKYFPFSYR